MQLSDILRPYWKEAEFSELERLQMYGLSREDFVVTARLADADVAVLPMTWNHYVTRGETRAAASFIEMARQAGRPVLSYVVGDEGVTVPPEFDDCWIVRAGGERRRRRKRQVAQPVFFDDPLSRYARLQDAAESVAADRSARTDERPAVGFCGQASISQVKVVTDVIRVLGRNAAYWLGMRHEEPQPLYPPALLRSRALQILRESARVRTEFIIRARYRAGATGAASIEKTTREFFENILGTDYTLCVRGGGNFSKRLFETMAMGRVPLLVDTDCLLPFESQVSWADVVVRVPAQALRTLPEKVIEHFARHRETGLAEVRQKCRRFWEETLSFRGFHKQLARIILDSGERSSGGASLALGYQTRGMTIPAG